uniref:Ig-like domain-containing protein n=1 Tax=Terrapene triunguis TaxID=2587831 RepID=A0A674ICM1_9SAUR
AKSTPPSVFPLVPCCTKTGSPPPDTSLACLVTGYLPSPVKITWNSGKVTQGVKNFPEVTMSDGLHTRSSLLILPDRSRQGDTYQCDVTHEGTPWCFTYVPLRAHGSYGNLALAPKPPAGPSVQGKTSAHCLTPSPSPSPKPNLLPLGEVEQSPFATSVQSLKAKPVQLRAQGPTCGSTTPPQVHLLAPTCEDSSTESQLELVCLLLSFKPGKADVKWLVNGKESSPPTPAFSSAMGTDGFYMGQSRMNVTKQSWEKGDVYTCQVTHPAVRTELSMHNTSNVLMEVDG